MSVFRDWQRYAVSQTHDYSCIAAGYEMILRAAGADGIDFATFQDEFNFDKDYRPGETEPHNSFGRIRTAIAERYPNVIFGERSFAQGDGAGKLAFIEEQLAQQRPILVSLALEPFGHDGWHIMPVVDIDDDTVTLLNCLRDDGSPDLLHLRKQDLVDIHNNFDGGKEVSYLERC